MSSVFGRKTMARESKGLLIASRSTKILAFAIKFLTPN
jgi:hypothetical protein